MSQYHYPYNPPPPGQGYRAAYYGQPDPLVPARRASVLLFVMGGLLMLGGLCCGAFYFIPYEQMAGQQAQMPQVDFGAARVSFAVAAGVLVIIALPLIVLGRFVRRGGLGSIVSALVITSLIGIVQVFQIVVGVASSLGTSPAAFAFAFVCMMALPLILVIMTIVFLAQAAKAAPQVRAMRDQSAMQYWQYQQNQQYYGQGGYPQQQYGQQQYEQQPQYEPPPAQQPYDQPPPLPPEPPPQPSEQPPDDPDHRGSA